MPTKRHVLLVVSDTPFDDEVLRRVTNHKCQHCISTSVEVDSLDRGGIGATVFEIDSRAMIGALEGTRGQGSSEGPAIADMLVHMLCSQKYLPAYERDGKYSDDEEHLP